MVLHPTMSMTIGIDSLQRSYVVYPPEGPRPPTAEELLERINKSKR